MKLKNWRDWAASLGGLIVSVSLAAAVIDFNTFDWHNDMDKIRLVLVVAPAVGGWLSAFKSKSKEEKPEN